MFDTNYLVGDVARLDIAVEDLAGNPIDPGSNKLLVMTPDGSIGEIAGEQIIKDGIGKYHCDLPLSVAGRTYYRWETGAPATAAAEGMINVQPSRFK